MKYFLKITIFLISINLFAQQGGMWLPSKLTGAREQEMKNLGSNLPASAIYALDKPSLKDAIVHFNGGCTAEVISKKALLLTNHHCGYGAIQSHSTTEHDYLQDGFWAYKQKEELPNPEMYVTFIKRIDDVSIAVLDGTSDKKSPKENQDIVSKNIQKIVKNAKKESWQDANVTSFYKGNQYFLFITEKYEDIRLVGAPPSAIGKFGADTDNWMWPRHTGDFSLFRIYADKDNRPTKYNKKNKPYKPVHYLPVATDGVKEGDFTLVFGFPGRTNEYLPAVALDQIVHKLNPTKIKIRDHALKIVDKYMRSNQEIKIKYASKFASIANYWKKWIGENQGIEKSRAIAKKRALEQKFTEKVKGTSSENLLKEFDSLYHQIEEVALARDIWIETVYRNVEILNATFRLYQLENTSRKGEEIFNKKRKALLEQFQKFYKNYDANVDKEVFENLVKLYFETNPKKYTPEAILDTDVVALTNKIFSKSALTSYDKAKQLLTGNMQEVIQKIHQDPAYVFGKELATVFYQKINPDYFNLQTKIAAIQKKYMKALMANFKEERFFPDANSTLRVTFGQVKGYEPKDAVYYEPISHLKGIIEKYVPGDYEFDVPQKLIDLYNKKDFGSYGKNGKMPVNFLGTNHTTGGNSGSPVIDANGNLIGLNFDRVWEGTMSDYNYDAAICRNIMVDVRYILFIMDKYAGAKRLIKEMDLVKARDKKRRAN
ncbi:MAG TPA: S46 family peptidase [Flavobacteriia bacterium]|nr:S46 family peptidase [Flavobacteriia bacterium]